MSGVIIAYFTPRLQLHYNALLQAHTTVIIYCSGLRAACLMLNLQFMIMSLKGTPK